jgi:hypothetical protein
MLALPLLCSDRDAERLAANRRALEHLWLRRTDRRGGPWRNDACTARTIGDRRAFGQRPAACLSGLRSSISIPHSSVDQDLVARFTSVSTNSYPPASSVRQLVGSVPGLRGVTI